ncbi:MAG: hypothetical protein GF311_10090 [Candidatus Lokiarchaeota archaeon]|nr:hypothetical protein [Candidatus Lokiarchaeota archaeon]
MKKDPLSIATSLVFNLNLLREGIEYNINEIKSLRNLENHWNTIQKYIKMLNIVKKFSPEFELKDSKIIIRHSELYRRLDQVERFILHLSNIDAEEPESAIELPEEFDIEKIEESEGYLYDRIGENKYYLRKSGKNIFRLIKENLSELIFQNKSWDDIFPFDSETTSSEEGGVIINLSDQMDYYNEFIDIGLPMDEKIEVKNIFSGHLTIPDINGVNNSGEIELLTEG